MLKIILLQSQNPDATIGTLFIIGIVVVTIIAIKWQIDEKNDEEERKRKIEEYHQKIADKCNEFLRQRAAVRDKFDADLDALENEYFPYRCDHRRVTKRSRTTDDIHVLRFRSDAEDLQRKYQEQYHIYPFTSEKYENLLQKYKTFSMRIDEENAVRKEAEARNQAEMTRKRNLAGKFKYITISGYKAGYWCDYFPLNRYTFVSHEQEANRRAIWDFKDGCYIIGLNKVSDFIDGNFTADQMRNLVFCVIPASTQYKNDKRYKTLCQKVADKLGIVNGYNYISIMYDRSDSREQKSYDTVGNLSFSSNIYGKDVVLFDDITTRGTSFVQAADKLKEKGARSVCGFFLGKTV